VVHGRGKETQLGTKPKRREPQTRETERNPRKKRSSKEKARTVAGCSALPLLILASPKVQVLLEFSVALNF
jgi:hypothetical protein